VDEAQRVNSVLLDQIRVLSNIELNDRKLINIFFIGQPEFKNLLLDAVNRPIRQRIAIYYHVQPLSETETGQYIEHRLSVAGAQQQIFNPDAIREIYRISPGHQYPLRSCVTDGLCLRINND
jgi:general secretion pathway protein A